ncbi:hypothetical protein [Sulfurimonas sp.]|jgi:hypothetical protein|uniref:CiaD-like domain-containing protein n=1 Tax=Sulfurimonas sp. TaxID=2022749 RepID=UPI0025E1EEC3|nr:hypothetical protein [Sulfurimonas sp.]MBT5935039.1 hypothetical protein [Sulfurimonas sp.]
MELKDVILSTLAEMEDGSVEQLKGVNKEEYLPQAQEEIEVNNITEENLNSIDNELAYLNSIRERLLVLFEGFQSPSNSSIESKVDMTLNFLEYTLATIDKRVQVIEKGNFS